jgi:hypothetical protein
MLNTISKNKFLLTFLLFSFLSNTAFAQQVVPLEKDQKAPFSGVLMPPAAVAQILAEKKACEDRIAIEIAHQLEVQKIKSELLTANLKARNETQAAIYNEVVLSKDKTIARLERDVADSRSDQTSKVWWMALGAAGGAIVTAVAVGFAVKIAR